MIERGYTYDHPRPTLTVDIIVLTRDSPAHVLLIRRGDDPFAGAWALPGGYVNHEEPLETAARRELREETSLEVGELEQLNAFGDPGRDPRGWTVTVAFVTLVDAGQVQPKAGDDAAATAWHPLDRLPNLAFDHDKILERARLWLAERKGNRR
jgi:8-oxo-dGTP diphosphatase